MNLAYLLMMRERVAELLVSPEDAQRNAISALDVACRALGGPAPKVLAATVIETAERLQSERERLTHIWPPGSSPRQTFAPALPGELWSDYASRTGVQIGGAG